MSVPEAGVAAGDLSVREEKPRCLLSTGWARSAPRCPALLEIVWLPQKLFLLQKVMGVND